VAAVATVLMVAVITVSVTKNVPINRWVAAQDPASLPADWRTRRVRWQRWNAARSVLAALALTANLATAALTVH
jgi:uncharacterized membrane protein